MPGPGPTLDVGGSGGGLGVPILAGDPRAGGDPLGDLLAIKWWCGDGNTYGENLAGLPGWWPSDFGESCGGFAINCGGRTAPGFACLRAAASKDGLYMPSVACTALYLASNSGGKGGMPLAIDMWGGRGIPPLLIAATAAAAAGLPLLR